MTLIGASALTSLQRGMTAIAGINVESRSRVYAPEFKDFLLDHVGEKRAFAIGATETKVTVKGQRTLTTGLPAITFVAASTTMADLDGYGQTTGGFYADSVTLDESNTGWLDFSVAGTRNQGIA